MEKRTLYVIVAAFIVIALVIASNLTGRSTIGECIDSDKGDAPRIPGTVTYTGADAVYIDECYAKGDQGIKKYLKERFCHVNMENQHYYCEEGCVENERGEGYCPEGRVSEME